MTILQFVGRVDAEGGFMVCEADNPADVLELPVQQVATQLGTNMAKGGQVLDAAVEYICPDARFG